MVKDKSGVILKYPERECKTCTQYPCMKMEIFKCDFAKYGCLEYRPK